jgi:hypothetical protein
MKTTYEKSIKPTVGTLLTAYDGEIYTRLGVEHLVTFVSEDTTKLDGTEFRYVTTVAINKDGNWGTRGVSFWVTDSGSIVPLNTHLSSKDGKWRPTFHRVPRHQTEYNLNKANGGTL